MWVYRETENGWEVGFVVLTLFESVELYDDPDQARAACHYLNGGSVYTAGGPVE